MRSLYIIKRDTRIVIVIASSIQNPDAFSRNAQQRKKQKNSEIFYIHAYTNKIDYDFEL